MMQRLKGFESFLSVSFHCIPFHYFSALLSLRPYAAPGYGLAYFHFVHFHFIYRFLHFVFAKPLTCGTSMRSVGNILFISQSSYFPYFPYPSPIYSLSFSFFSFSALRGKSGERGINGEGKGRIRKKYVKKRLERAGYYSFAIFPAIIPAFFLLFLLASVFIFRDAARQRRRKGEDMR